MAQKAVPQKSNDEIRLSVSLDRIKRELEQDAVVVHLHGHGIYKGVYWLLRRKAGRGEKRETLAQGKPAKLAELVKGLGYELCLDHRKVGCECKA